MMKALTIFDISGRAMAAQQVRLNAVASNLANAQTVANAPDKAYRALRPVFEAEFPTSQYSAGVASVSAVDIERSNVQPEKRYSPGHPLADAEGYIYSSNVDVNEELVDMLEASRQYQNNIEVLATAKSLLMKTLSVGK
ncbi:MAG: flagellar basal body rod protein FlgC [Beijerinckiaceae bacterium]|jgi:flagellar basal-body rod protein FlgC